MLTRNDTSRWLALTALRHRRAQSIVLLLLAVVAIAACAAGPMYQRAVEQAAIRSQLGQAGTSDRGVTVHAGSAAEATGYLPQDGQRSLFGIPVAGMETTVAVTATRSAFNAMLVGRDDVCGHLVLTAGRCPDGGQQLLVSASSAAALHLAVGDQLGLTGLGGSAQYRIGSMRVVGVYQPFEAAGDYWFDRSYSSAAGLRRVPKGDAVPDLLVGDAMFVSPAGVEFLEAARAAANAGGDSPFDYQVDLPVPASRIGIAQSSRLLSAINGIQARIDAAHPAGDPARGRLTSKLADLLRTAEAGRRQTRLIIPLLAVQLAMLVLVVLGLVLAIGVDQRRVEIGLARLRGQSRRAAAQLFVAEIAVLVSIALLPGMLAGWLGCQLLVRWWLPPGTPVEPWRRPVWGAGLAVAVLALLLAVGLARRAAGRPIGQLLRSVAPARPAGRLTAAEAGLAVAAIAGVAVVLTGDRSSAVALITASLLALLAGLVLSRLLLLVARGLGRRALWRGRLTTALAAFEVARRPGIRRVVTLICVAVALLVSAVDVQAVSAANRAGRAAASVGAPVVLDVDPPTAAALRAAVARFDPAGNYAMAVVTQRPDGGDTPVVAVDHSRLRRIARWGSSRDTPGQQLVDRLVPAAAPPPIRLTGNQLRLRTDQASVRADPGSSDHPQPVSLSLRLQLPDGSFTTAVLPVRSGAAVATSTTAVGGCLAGCTPSRIEVVRAIGDFSSADVSLRILGLAAGRPGALRPVSLGGAQDWGNSEAAAAAAGTAASIGFGPGPGNSLVLHAVSHGTGATLQHLDVPVNLPCLLAGPVQGDSPDSGADGGIAMHGIDGQSAQCQPVGDMAFLPRLGTGVLVTDLNLAITAAQPVLTNSTAAVWLSRDDPAAERALVRALGAAGIPVSGRDTISHQRAGFDASPPAWAVRLALAAALLAAVIAGLMVVIAAFSAQRTRSYDLAALRLVGLRPAVIRRGVLAEQLAAVCFAVLVGAATGVLGARLSLPALPLFVDPPTVPRPRYDVPWWSVAAAVGAALVLLLGAGAVAAAVLGRRLDPDRLREGD